MLRNKAEVSLCAALISIRNIFFFLIFDKLSAGGHFVCPKITFDRISGHFRSIGHFGYRNETFYVLKILTKWPPAAILDGTTMSIIELVRDIWMSSACVKFE